MEDRWEGHIEGTRTTTRYPVAQPADWEALRPHHPRLIYCSISGFGHQGDPAYTQLPGYDAIVQGLSGLQHVTGQPDGPPTRIGVPISDLLSGMAAFQAILAALYQRERTGLGRPRDRSTPCRFRHGKVPPMASHASRSRPTNPSRSKQGR